MVSLTFYLIRSKMFTAISTLLGTLVVEFFTIYKVVMLIILSAGSMKSSIR